MPNAPIDLGGGKAPAAPEAAKSSPSSSTKS
jgi:hypothetical protein